MFSDNLNDVDVISIAWGFFIYPQSIELSFVINTLLVEPSLYKISTSYSFI